MTTTPQLPSLVLGVVAGISLVLACGDDGGSPIDAAAADAAAACECPASEPPLAGRIVDRVRALDVPPMDQVYELHGCDAGERLISGGCTTTDVDPRLVLNASGPDGTGSWSCIWTSTATTAIHVDIVVTCLAPP